MGSAVAVTVMVVATVPEAGTLTWAGLQLQVIPDAMPPQPKLTGPAEPFVEVSDTVKLADFPTAIVAEVPGATVALIVPTVSVAG